MATKSGKRKQRDTLACIAKKSCTKCFGKGFTETNMATGELVPCSCAVKNYEKLKQAQVAGAIRRIEESHDSLWKRLVDAWRVITRKAAAIRVRKRI